MIRVSDWVVAANCAPDLDSPRSAMSSAVLTVGEVATSSGCRLPDGRVALVLVLDADEAAAALASYDPTSSTSPSAADSRRIARAVLDGMQKAAGAP
jgi:hypothetical protein